MKKIALAIVALGLLSAGSAQAETPQAPTSGIEYTGFVFDAFEITGDRFFYDHAKIETVAEGPHTLNILFRRPIDTATYEFTVEYKRPVSTSNKQLVSYKTLPAFRHGTNNGLEAIIPKENSGKLMSISIKNTDNNAVLCISRIQNR